MTYLENLEPLLKAAEKYAELTRLREKLWAGEPGHIGQTSIAHKEAADALLATAVEYAKWGK